MSAIHVSSLQEWVLSLHILVSKCLAPSFSLEIIKGRSSIEKSKRIKAEMFWLQLETHQAQSPPHTMLCFQESLEFGGIQLETICFTQSHLIKLMWKEAKFKNVKN